MKLKKILAIALSIMLLLNCVMPAALAADPDIVNFTVTADKSEAKAGDTINFTVYLCNADTVTDGVFNTTFTLDIPEGLTFVSGSGVVNSSFSTTTGIIAPTFLEASLTLSAMGAFGAGYAGEDIAVMSFRCTVDDSALGSYTVGIEEHTISGNAVTVDSTAYGAELTVTKAPGLIAGPIAVTVNPEPTVGMQFMADNSVTVAAGNYIVVSKSISPDDNIQAGNTYTVSVTIKPNDGYYFNNSTSAAVNGEAATVTLNNDGTIIVSRTYAFAPALSEPSDEEEPECPRDNTCSMYGYTDLNMNLWYHDGVHYCIENGLMQGVGNSQFNPNGTTTRAMLVTILWRLEGSPLVDYAMNFKDVASGMWYTGAIRWAASSGIVEGYGDTFGPSDTLTREQMVTILWRYARNKGYDVSIGENTSIHAYGDASSVSGWAISAMQWACGSGMIQGVASGTTMNLDPTGSATRAQAATMLYRFIANVATAN